MKNLTIFSLMLIMVIGIMPIFGQQQEMTHEDSLLFGYLNPDGTLVSQPPDDPPFVYVNPDDSVSTDSSRQRSQPIVSTRRPASASWQQADSPSLVTVPDGPMSLDDIQNFIQNNFSGILNHQSTQRYMEDNQWEEIFFGAGTGDQILQGNEGIFLEYPRGTTFPFEARTDSSNSSGSFDNTALADRRAAAMKEIIERYHHIPQQRRHRMNMPAGRQHTTSRGAMLYAPQRGYLQRAILELMQNQQLMHGQLTAVVKLLQKMPSSLNSLEQSLLGQIQEKLGEVDTKMTELETKYRQTDSIVKFSIIYSMSGYSRFDNIRDLFCPVTGAIRLDIWRFFLQYQLGIDPWSDQGYLGKYYRDKLEMTTLGFRLATIKQKVPIYATMSLVAGVEEENASKFASLQLLGAGLGVTIEYPVARYLDVSGSVGAIHYEVNDVTSERGMMAYGMTWSIGAKLKMVSLF